MENTHQIQKMLVIIRNWYKIFPEQIDYLREKTDDKDNIISLLNKAEKPYLTFDQKVSNNNNNSLKNQFQTQTHRFLRVYQLKIIIVLITPTLRLIVNMSLMIYLF